MCEDCRVLAQFDEPQPMASLSEGDQAPMTAARISEALERRVKGMSG